MTASGVLTAIAGVDCTAVGAAACYIAWKVQGRALLDRVLADQDGGRGFWASVWVQIRPGGRGALVIRPAATSPAAGRPLAAILADIDTARAAAEFDGTPWLHTAAAETGALDPDITGRTFLALTRQYVGRHPEGAAS